MNCPVCKETALVMSERQGVEIDYCPACRGVWLDRGELDKIIERSAGAPAATAQPLQGMPMGYRSGTRGRSPQGRPLLQGWSPEEELPEGSLRLTREEPDIAPWQGSRRSSPRTEPFSGSSFVQVHLHARWVES